MKKNIFILVALVAAALVVNVIYFFWPANDDHMQQTVEPIDIAATTMTASPTQEDRSNQSDTEHASTAGVQMLSDTMSVFVGKVESILQGAQTRESKIISLLDILRHSKSDEEKIATLQSLASLKPIEYADDLILLAASDEESAKVRAEAIRTLNQSYLVSDKDVQRIGGASVYVQMEKISQYVDSVVGDTDTPPEMYNAALQGYAVMKPDKSVTLTKEMMNKSGSLNEAESSFFNDTMFLNNQNLTALLPVIQKNPDKITDSMASQMAVMSADPTILNQLTKAEKQHIISILKTHNLDPNNPMLQVASDTINAKIEEIERSL